MAENPTAVASPVRVIRISAPEDDFPDADFPTGMSLNFASAAPPAGDDAGGVDEPAGVVAPEAPGSFAFEHAAKATVPTPTAPTVSTERRLIAGYTSTSLSLMTDPFDSSLSQTVRAIAPIGSRDTV